MADLFSFGSGDQEGSNPANTATSTTATGSASDGDVATAVSAAPYRSNSDDSFLDLLEDSPDLLSGSSSLSTAPHDAETQEILAWLDEEKSPATSTTEQQGTKEDEEQSTDKTSTAASATTSPKAETKSPSKTNVPPAVPKETVVALPPVFKSLTSALASSQATVGQIRHLAADQLDDITPMNRSDLYCRLLTGKSLNAIQSQSSLVDAFTSWQTSEARKDEIAPSWMQLSCEALAQRVAESLEKTHATHKDKEACRQDLLDVLQYHARGLPKSNEDEEQPDVFIPPVAATFLGFSVPAAVASVLTTQLMGQHMPVLALQPAERWEAAQGLHQHLYWLACYHLPLLVFHLDRYVQHFLLVVDAHSIVL